MEPTEIKKSEKRKIIPSYGMRIVVIDPQSFYHRMAGTMYQTEPEGLLVGVSLNVEAKVDNTNPKLHWIPVESIEEEDPRPYRSDYETFAEYDQAFWLHLRSLCAVTLRTYEKKHDLP